MIRDPAGRLVTRCHARRYDLLPVRDSLTQFRLCSRLAVQCSDGVARRDGIKYQRARRIDAALLAELHGRQQRGAILGDLRCRRRMLRHHQLITRVAFRLAAVVYQPALLSLDTAITYQRVLDGRDLCDRVLDGWCLREEATIVRDALGTVCYRRVVGAEFSLAPTRSGRETVCEAQLDLAQHHLRRREEPSCSDAMGGRRQVGLRG